MLQGIKHIYYRGYLKSCQYKCHYCPFSKRRCSSKELEEDEKALHQFVSKVEAIKSPISIMFTPYGEAMGHKYYQEAMAYLSSLEHVTKIGCQTNLGFSIKDLEESIGQCHGDWSKLRFWCSYHPEMVREEQFIYQCEQLLKRGVDFCVGAVAVPENIILLQSIRRHLPAMLYMWLNKMDGLKRAYTEEEIIAFTAIDPLFDRQFQSQIQNKTSCVGGVESLFVEANGNCYPCNISKHVMGNLYTGEKDIWGCKSKRCSCYLAYVHQMDEEEASLFGEHKYFRIPDRNRISTFFFDLDGTLLSRNGKLDENTKKTIQLLAKTKTIYLATSRPYESAMKKCRDIQQLLAGGAFSNGAECYIASSNKWYITALNPIGLAFLQERQNQDLQIKTYASEDKLYKITVLGNRADLEAVKSLLQEIHPNVYHLALEGHTLSITNSICSKAVGIQKILKYTHYNQNQVAVVANSENDVEMLQAFEESIVVPSSKQSIKEQSKWVLPIEALPWIY